MFLSLSSVGIFQLLHLVCRGYRRFATMAALMSVRFGGSTASPASRRSLPAWSSSGPAPGRSDEHRPAAPQRPTTPSTAGRSVSVSSWPSVLTRPVERYFAFASRIKSEAGPLRPYSCLLTTAPLSPARRKRLRAYRLNKDGSVTKTLLLHCPRLTVEVENRRPKEFVPRRTSPSLAIGTPHALAD